LLPLDYLQRGSPPVISLVNAVSVWFLSCVAWLSSHLWRITLLLSLKFIYEWTLTPCVKRCAENISTAL
jgi:hypothetical protein